MWVATRGSWPYYFDATLVLLGVPGLTTRRKRCLPSGRHVCVTLGIIGILLDLFGWLLSEQGAHGHLDGMGQRRPIQAVVKTYLLGAPGRIIRRSWWPPFFLL